MKPIHVVGFIVAVVGFVAFRWWGADDDNFVTLPDGTRVPTPRADSPAISAADVRTGWSPTLVDVAAPVPYGMVGCTFRGGAQWLRSDTLVDGTAGPAADSMFCPPPSWRGRGCKAPEWGRPWWLPVRKADRSDATVDVGVLMGGHLADLATGDVRSVRAVTYGSRVYVESSDTLNFTHLGVEGGLLFIAADSWTAVFEDGTPMRRNQVRFTYQGARVEPASYPMLAKPWRRFDWPLVSVTRRVTATQKGDRLPDGTVLQYDAVGPIALWAMLRRPFKTVGGMT